MKKYFFLLSIVAGTTQAQTLKQPGFRVEGHLKGLEERSLIVMTDANQPTDTFARAAVKGGLFILTGHLPEPNLVNLNFIASKKKKTLFIGNETVTINGNMENLAAAQVSGSPSETDFLAFEQIFNPVSYTHLTLPTIYSV